MVQHRHLDFHESAGVGQDMIRNVSMYHLHPVEYDNEKPWLYPFSARVQQLFEARRLGMRISLYVYEKPDTSSFRYRVYNVHQSLEISLHWRSVYFYKDELDKVEGWLNLIDLLVVARFKWTFELQRFIDCAKKLGIKVAFDVDDMVYHLKHVPAVLKTISMPEDNQSENDFWFAYISEIQSTVSQCDFAITTNGFLAEKMQADLGMPAYVIQNYLNRLQLNVSAQYYEQKQAMNSTGPFEIGYFSGSNTHYHDFLVAAPELKRLLQKYEDITLKLVGFMELPPFMSKLEKEGRIKRVPLLNFIELQKEIAESDVNIVPLVNNEFSNCKSELKFFEAALVGTVTCATPSFVFCEAIQDGVTGYLCDKGQWFDRLENLYLNRRHTNGDMVRTARDYCLDRYAYYNQVQSIEETFDALIQQSRFQRPAVSGEDMSSIEQKYRRVIQAEYEKRDELENKFYMNASRLSSLESELSRYKQRVNNLENEKEAVERELAVYKRNWFARRGYAISVRINSVKKRYGKHSDRRLLKKEENYWSPVFDSSVYCQSNPDIAETIGTDKDRLLHHFICYGMNEGRKASENFDVYAYLQCNPDVAALCMYDKKEAYLHYLENGIKEKRRATWE